MENRWVEIVFDCLPLRSITRLDIPLDASPKYRALCERIRAAIAKHGSLNTFYLYNGHCRYRLVNAPDKGMIGYTFEGTVITNSDDTRCQHCDLVAELASETCDWLTQPVTDWFAETVPHSVAVEFDRYIAAGDLEQTRKRLEKIEAESNDSDGFLGMYL